MGIANEASKHAITCLGTSYCISDDTVRISDLLKN